MLPILYLLVLSMWKVECDKGYPKTPLHGRLPKSGYKGTVLKTVRSVKRHVGSNPTSSFVLSTTQNYWERNPLSRTNTGESEVECFILPPPQKGLNSCKDIYFVPQRRAFLERGVQKFLEQVSCSSYFNYRGYSQAVRQ